MACMSALTLVLGALLLTTLCSSDVSVFSYMLSSNLMIVCLHLQALKVYVPDFESRGRMWPHIHNRFLAALFVAQLTLLGYFGVKKFAYAPILIILPILTYAFYLYCKRNYYPSFAVVSLFVASQEVKEFPSVQACVEAFIPACLLEGENYVDLKFHDLSPASHAV